MEHFISLTIKTDQLTDDLPRSWYKVVKEHVPAGMITTVQNGDEQAIMKKSKKDGKISLSIPLVRDLTEKEVEKIIGIFKSKFEDKFSISSSKIKVGVQEEVELQVDYEPLINLCTAWAKEQHDEWMKDKVDSGWRYGPAVSMSNKTHPLLRPWSDLPDAYKVIDTKKPEELLKLLNDHGYVLVKKDELDTLLKDQDRS